MTVPKKKTCEIDTTQTPAERELAYAIAEAVHSLRTERDMSQATLAEATGAKQPRISVVESATGIPSLRLLLRIASTLNTRLVVRFEDPEGNRPAGPGLPARRPGRPPVPAERLTRRHA